MINGNVGWVANEINPVLELPVEEVAKPFVGEDVKPFLDALVCPEAALAEVADLDCAAVLLVEWTNQST